MFGLEGSGFIISISLTFLLVGLVVYLMKRQMWARTKFVLFCKSKINNY